MNKQELVEAVSKELETSKAGGEGAVNAVLCGITKGVKKDKTRTARNPQAGDPIKVKASRTVGFKVGKKFKDMV